MQPSKYVYIIVQYNLRGKIMTEENTTENTEASATNPETGQPAGVPQLTINDMIVLKNMVEITQSRGAFKADEMTTVGNVYNKLSIFLQAVMPKNTGNAAPEGDTAGNVAPDTGNVSTDGGNIMTPDGDVIDTGNVATDTGNVSGDSA